MATADEYAAVEQPLLKAMLGEEHEILAKVPPFLLGSIQGMIPPDAASKAATAAAHIAVDALDAYRASHPKKD